jgi:hypothetical protein
MPLRLSASLGHAEKNAAADGRSSHLNRCCALLVRHVIVWMATRSVKPAAPDAKRLGKRMQFHECVGRQMMPGAVAP